MTDELRFDDLTPIEVPVHVGAARYTLREATEATASRYRNEQTRCFKMSSGEMSGITGPIANTQALLVSLCLFDESDRNVAIEVIRSWPSRIVKPIFAMAQEISDLSESEDEADLLKQKAEIEKKLAAIGEDKAKNSQTDSTDGSD